MGLVIGLLVAAHLIGVGVAEPLAIGGIRPEPVVPVVLAAGLASGPRAGAIGGFVAGLLLDFGPASIHLAGAGALMMATCGALAGLWADRAPGRLADRQGYRRLWAACTACGFVLVTATGIRLLSTFAGAGSPPANPMSSDLLGTGVATAVLAAIVVPALASLLERTRRLEPLAR